MAGSGREVGGIRGRGRGEMVRIGTGKGTHTLVRNGRGFAKGRYRFASAVGRGWKGLGKEGEAGVGRG